MNTGISISLTAVLACILFAFLVAAAEREPKSPTKVIQFFKQLFGWSFIAIFAGLIWWVWS